MSSDFVLVETKGWEYDLHSVYSAYIGYFQVYNVPWIERSWGHFFESFDAFLAFSWPVITVADAKTGKAHIVTRLNYINAFIKMIKTRFGETLPQAPNILQVTPFDSGQRRLRHVADYGTYTRLYATLPAALVAALKTRVRAGEPQVIKDLWDKRDRTFLAIDFELNERNEKTVLEWGYAAVRCGHLDALGHWPPLPDSNYRKGHYIVAEHVDKIVNKHFPTYPWQYAFGDSQVISKTKLPQMIQTIISSLASPESETMANTLVLVAHGIQGHLARLEEMKIRFPSNMLYLDTMVLEKAMYANGQRGVMLEPKGEQRQRAPGSTLSLENLLVSFTLPLTSESTPIALPQCTLHNAGNDAFLTLFALQKLLEPTTTKTPSVTKGRSSKTPATAPAIMAPMTPMATGFAPNPMAAYMAQTMPFNGSAPLLVPPYPNFGYNSMPSSPGKKVGTPTRPKSNSNLDLAGEFGQMQIEHRRHSRAPSNGAK